MAWDSFAIVNGPSKWDGLVFALMDTRDGLRTVEFVVQVTLNNEFREIGVKASVRSLGYSRRGEDFWEVTGDIESVTLYFEEQRRSGNVDWIGWEPYRCTFNTKTRRGSLHTQVELKDLYVQPA